MTRKDSERETERPRYYSQFWLDVAAGRKVIGAPKTDEEVESVEPEAPEPVGARKSERTDASVGDGYREIPSRSMVEPAFAPDEVDETEPELEDDLLGNVDELEIPTLATEEIEAPDMDLAPVEEEEEEAGGEEFYDEDEEDEGFDWSARGRKKPKPGRQVKQPKRGAGKRDQRRGF